MREGDELAAGSGLTRDERRRDPSRVLALTDGVYAIIITLLVLDIHVPTLEAHETLGTAISEVRPSFISFTIAFIVAAMQWVGHRDLFTLIRDTDRGIVWLSLLTLFTACLLPFGSALLSRYHQDPLALRMFGLILIATSLSRTIIWVYATRRPSVVHDPIDRPSYWSGLALSVFPLVIYVAAFAVAGVLGRGQPGRLRLGAGAVLHHDHAAALASPRGSEERQFT